MNLVSWIVLGLVVLWGIAALVYVIRHRGSNCGGSCGGGCNGDCAHCKCRPRHAPAERAAATPLRDRLRRCPRG